MGSDRNEAGLLTTNGHEITRMKTYQVLSVVKPAGARIRAGLKTIEVRRWRPDELPLCDLLIVENEIRLSRTGVTEDPNGRVVALVDVVAVTDWLEDDLAASCAPYWEEGWLAWRLENIRPVDSAEQVPACRRLYELEFPEELG